MHCEFKTVPFFLHKMPARSNVYHNPDENPPGGIRFLLITCFDPFNAGFEAFNAGEKRELWIIATAKTYGPSAKVVICEDHFDLRNDVDYFRINGSPVLLKWAYPHRNLTISDMELQAKLDKINWECFVPSCENRRLDIGRKVIFFRVPEGPLGQLWKSSVAGDEICFSGSSASPDTVDICCEDHFDIMTDVNKKFHSDSSVVYTIKDGILPRFNLNDMKPADRDMSAQIRLLDAHPHHKTIRNNDVDHLYESKYPQLIERLQLPDDVAFISMKAIKTEPIELGENIVEHSMVEVMSTKIEPLDNGYEYPIMEDSNISDFQPIDAVDGNMSNFQSIDMVGETVDIDLGNPEADITCDLPKSILEK
ncbi:hypothetical protein Bhyg_06184 [Pseudolycoriella hygida]|uniref:THAP-type domain-containing protein n=1 Tax=Pseudolycoriella hygida TaxID=35572 RepID=A0A9Q0S1P5_9DIPT|nr:hypothetical protein Bhyg_06184 [Pseudolycoriella hygida]